MCRSYLNLKRQHNRRISHSIVGHALKEFVRRTEHHPIHGEPSLSRPGAISALDQHQAKSGTASLRFAWMLLAILFAGSVLNYLDRAVLGVLMPQVRHSLSLSNKDYGLVVNAFLLLYMAFYIVGGRISDWLGSRHSFIFNVTGWSIASMLHALSQGLVSLCAFRALLGAAEGGFFPTAIRSIADWFPLSHRAKAIGILLCGMSIGSFIAPPAVAWVAVRYGWRAAFLGTGALGFFLLLPWLLLQSRKTHPPFAVDSAAAPGPAPPHNVPILRALWQRKYLFLLGARSITDAIWFFCLFWIPGYFQEARGFNLLQVGRLLWIPYFSADLGALLGTWGSSALLQRGLSLDRSRKTVLIPSALLSLCSIGTFYAHTNSVALFCFCIALFGLFSWAGNVQYAITEVVPQQHVALLYGITGAVGTFLSAISQLFIGRAVDHVGYKPIFLALGSGLPLALVLVFSAGRITLWKAENADLQNQPS